MTDKERLELFKRIESLMPKNNRDVRIIAILIIWLWVPIYILPGSASYSLHHIMSVGGMRLNIKLLMTDIKNLTT